MRSEKLEQTSKSGMDGNFSKQVFFLNSCLRQATLKLIINKLYLLLFSDTDASEQQNGECVTDAKEASV